MLDTFLWSKDFPLQVCVFNSTSLSDQAHDTHESQLQAATLEYTRVQTLLAALTPHIKRCKLLHFELLYPTSLPPAAFFLQRLPNLKELTLLSGRGIPPPPFVVGFGNPWTIGNPIQPVASRPSLCWLNCLAFDAFTFMCLARAFKGLWSEICYRDRHLRLSIWNYTFRPARRDRSASRFTFEEFIGYLVDAGFGCLSLRNMHIAGPRDISAEPSNHPEPYSSSYTGIRFENVSRELISECLSICDLRQQESFAFRSCDIPPIDDFFGYFLKLENIPRSTDLQGVLKLWQGRQLTIGSSACFNDSLLAWFSDNRRCAQYLDSLFLFDCDSFSMEALKEFIDARTEELGEEDGEDLNDFDEEPCIRELRVQGGGHTLADEDRLWFQQRVKRFSFE
ncbi:unnamed protein product [Cyclocybe aegerita]|uniref:Uncharacterized protein n=1 Tax=Cyclocybe aegerita TaxID=1973307 RepID=A0A8S0W7Q3_CYCAE|nr:unnamed protein product [Cyclocybe aegerita]